MIPIPTGEIGKAICEKYFPEEEWEKEYRLKTGSIRRISEYTGFDFNEILELPYPYFLLLNKESWIASYTKSKEGMEILKNLWRLRQTKADEKSVRRHSGGGYNGVRN